MHLLIPLPSSIFSFSIDRPKTFRPPHSVHVVLPLSSSFRRRFVVVVVVSSSFRRPFVVVSSSFRPPCPFRPPPPFVAVPPPFRPPLSSSFRCHMHPFPPVVSSFSLRWFRWFRWFRPTLPIVALLWILSETKLILLVGCTHSVGIVKHTQALATPWQKNDKSKTWLQKNDRAKTWLQKNDRAKTWFQKNDKSKTWLPRLAK